MRFFTTDKIKAADAYTITHEPVSSINLMERAAEQLADWISGNLLKEDHFKIFAGPGNNGGDALALARILFKRGFANIELFLLQVSERLSTDAEINRKRLISESSLELIKISSASDFPKISENDYLIDGLFGSGLSRPLEGLAAQLVKYLNKSQNRGIIAIDMPSGLFGEDNSGNNYDAIVRVDYTLSFEFPKLSFFFPENNEFVGEWHILPIGLSSDFIENEPSPFNYIGEVNVLQKLHSRKKFSHKGTYGHALLISGSYGMMGAAVLSAKAAMRAGAGLVTAHIPATGTDILQSAVPEVLLSIDPDKDYFTCLPALESFSAIGIGPGLNKNEKTRKSVLQLLKVSRVPLILDADALNIIAETSDWQKIIPADSLLTPHPKEFERLFGKFPDSYARLKAQTDFSQKSKCIVILKGANSCITTPGGEIWFNLSGNPGMATGGSGDVLTGIIAGLVAQGYSISDAAILGVYIHGCAGDYAAIEQGQHGLIASDIIDNIGRIFSVLENKKPST